jgi:hypothetical protein
MGMRLIGVCRAACVAAAAATIACSDLSPGDEFRKARDRWERSGPSSYSFVSKRTCYCMENVLLPVLIVVTDGVITSRTYESSGEPVTIPSAFKDVDGILAEIATALEQGASVNAEYDRHFGFPVSVYIDFPRTVDDETGITITKFTPR